jgi:hypothetical protein
VFVRKIEANGTQGGSAVRVNPEEGTATAWRGDPPAIAVAPDNSIYVGWTARGAAKGHETNLYLSASRDGGKSFDPPVKVNDDAKPTRHGMHSLAVDGEGRIYIAWLDERNTTKAAPTAKHRGEASEMESNNELFTAHSTDGGRTISSNQMIAKDTCPCCKTAIATAPDGRIYIGWRQVLKGDYRHIAVSTSGDKGATYSAPVIVSDDQWVIAGCPVSGPSLSVQNDGTLRVLWYTEGNEQGLYFTRSSDQAKTFAKRQIVSKGSVRGNPFVVADYKGDGVVAIWNAEDMVLMRSEILSDGTIKERPSRLTTGDLPSAAASNDKLAVAYISTVNKQRSIWLYRSGKETAHAKL